MIVVVYASGPAYPITSARPPAVDREGMGSCHEERDDEENGEKKFLHTYLMTVLPPLIRRRPPLNRKCGGGAVNIHPLPGVGTLWLFTLPCPANQVFAGVATEC